MTVERGDVVWEPPADVLDTSVVGSFMRHVEREHGVSLTTHEALWEWSVAHLEDFWGALWHFYGVKAHAPYETVLVERVMPGARWFPGALLNFAEHMLGEPEDADRVAVLGRSQTRPDVELTFGQLRDQVARAQQVLRDLGVRKGDRVAGYLPNAPEALVAHLAAASLGAIWSSCAIELGPRSVVDRFAQVEPAVLLVAGGYYYGEKRVERAAEVAEIRTELPGATVLDVRYGDFVVDDAASWPDLLAAAPGGEPEFEPVPFDHPLVILFSSGTTGLPKAIVHCHGGILLESVKNHGLSWDMGPDSRLLWFTTTTWMMWNALVASLLLRSSIVMIDGNPLHPDLTYQWRLAAETRATIVGASPGFIMACLKAGVTLEGLDLSAVEQIGSAGSPLPPEGYAWVADQLPHAMLNIGSGGTDICSGIVQGSPLLPVYAGEIAGRCLAVDVHAFDESGQRVVGELGELVICSPLPSMPVAFWGDDDGSRLRAAYFEFYPGAWRHGDWIVFNDNGSCHIAGRSDATLNRGGVRLGTAEFYRVAEQVPGVADSLVVHLEDPAGGNGELILFVATEEGVALDDDLRATLTRGLRAALSPRHVPDEIIEVDMVPRNLTGKKLELPVKRILQGADPDSVASRDSLAVPGSLDAYVALAAARPHP